MKWEWSADDLHMICPMGEIFDVTPLGEPGIAASNMRNADIHTVFGRADGTHSSTSRIVLLVSLVQL